LIEDHENGAGPHDAMSVPSFQVAFKEGSFRQKCLSIPDDRPLQSRLKFGTTGEFGADLIDQAKFGMKSVQ
jgi:hypothetical protein